MSAAAELKPSRLRPRSHRSTTMPTCKVCAAQMVAAEASMLGENNVVSYLWSCDVCGYGFVTDTAVGSTRDVS